MKIWGAWERRGGNKKEAQGRRRNHTLEGMGYHMYRACIWWGTNKRDKVTKGRGWAGREEMWNEELLQGGRSRRKWRNHHFWNLLMDSQMIFILVDEEMVMFHVFSWFFLLVGFLILGAKNMKELDLTELRFRGSYLRLKTKKSLICGFARAKMLFND